MPRCPIIESQDFKTTLREYMRAFNHLGGVAARYDGGEPIYNRRFLAFTTHYGYRLVA